MMPWGHLAIGYLTYSLGSRAFLSRLPSELPVIVLLFGTQLSDLIDKPLFYASVLPVGRTIGHSYYFLIPLSLTIIYITQQRDKKVLGTAFTVGILTHPIADGFSAIKAGNYNRLTYMLWPVLPSPEYRANSLHDHIALIIQQIRTLQHLPPTGFFTTTVGQQIILSILFLLLWIMDGYPGLQLIISRIRRKKQ